MNCVYVHIYIYMHPKIEYFILMICCSPTGLCNPEKKMLELHQKEACFKTPTLESDDK